MKKYYLILISAMLLNNVAYANDQGLTAFNSTLAIIVHSSQALLNISKTPCDKYSNSDDFLKDYLGNNTKSDGLFNAHIAFCIDFASYHSGGGAGYNRELNKCTGLVSSPNHGHAKGYRNIFNKACRNNSLNKVTRDENVGGY